MALIKSASKTARNKNIKTDDLSINWPGQQKPSQGLGRRWGEVREFTSRTRGRPRPALSKCRVKSANLLRGRGAGRGLPFQNVGWRPRIYFADEGQAAACPFKMFKTGPFMDTSCVLCGQIPSPFVRCRLSCP